MNIGKEESAVMEQLERGKKLLLVARLYDVAQELVDQRKPGETVTKVVIETNTAAPEPTSEPAQKPAKFYVMYRAKDGDIWPTTVRSEARNTHSTLKEAYNTLKDIEDKEPSQFGSYFILATSERPYGI